MPSVFKSEEERLAYLIAVDAMEGMKQLRQFISLTTDAASQLKILNAVTKEFGRATQQSFTQAKQGMAQINAMYTQAAASGNRLASGGVGAGSAGIGGVGWGGSGGAGGITSSINQIPPAVNNAKSALGSLATTFRHVIVGMLAFRVIQFFMDIIQGIGAATQAAKEFYKSLVNIEMGVRAMQRAGMNVTLNEFIKAIQLLKQQFPVFSEQQLASGFDNAILKTAQMKMNYADIIKLMEISAGVAAVTGKSMESVTDALINAMLSSSGRMTITLAEATNLQINQADIVRKAKELQIKSIENGVKALSNEERKTVILALAWEQYLRKQEDINASMESSSSQLDEVNSRWADFKKNIGLVVLELKTKFAPIILGVINFLQKGIPGLVAGILLIAAPTILVTSLILGLVNAFKDASSSPFLSKDWAKKWDEGFKKGILELPKMISGAIAGASNISKGIEDLFGDVGTKAGEAFAEGLTTEQEDALADFEKNIADMKKDIDRKLEQDLVDLGRKNADIDTSYEQQKVQDAIDATRAVEDINRNASESIADANLKYRENELKAEEDYQRQLQKLRDQFLFDLEDALRTQDAGQIRRLIRKYQLDKKNLIQDNAAQTTERQRQLAEELADIERQRQRKLADAARDAEYKRQKSYEDWLRDRADAQLHFEQDQADEATRNKQKLQDLVDALTDQGLATQAGAQAIVDIMMTYFGPGGYTDVIYNYLMAKIQAATQMAAAIGSGWSGMPGVNSNRYDPTRGYASGGAMIASKPTTAVFGEGGEPELAVFLPLSKIRNPVGNASIRNVGGGTGGKINLEVLLSPDLEARIVKQAANNVATTITRIQREK